MVHKNVETYQINDWILDQYKWYTTEPYRIETEVAWEEDNQVTIVMPGIYMLTGTLSKYEEGIFEVINRHGDNVSFTVGAVYMVARTKGITHFIIILKP